MCVLKSRNKINFSLFDFFLTIISKRYFVCYDRNRPRDGNMPVYVTTSTIRKFQIVFETGSIRYFPKTGIRYSSTVPTQFDGLSMTPASGRRVRSAGRESVEDPSNAVLICGRYSGNCWTSDRVGSPRRIYQRTGGNTGSS